MDVLRQLLSEGEEVRVGSFGWFMVITDPLGDKTVMFCSTKSLKQIVKAGNVVIWTTSECRSRKWRFKNDIHISRGYALNMMKYNINLHIYVSKNKNIKNDSPHIYWYWFCFYLWTIIFHFRCDIYCRVLVVKYIFKKK